MSDDREPDHLVSDQDLGKRGAGYEPDARHRKVNR